MLRLPVIPLTRVISSTLAASALLVVTSCGSDDKSQGTSDPVPSNVTTAEAQAYVDAVNAVRAAVTQPSNYAGAWAPLPEVTWSDTVAASAQGWANYLASKGCNLEHEGQSAYGENLAMGTNLTAPAAVAMWASEKDKYTWSAIYSMEDFNRGSGHYTQLVWRASVQLGCGTAKCASSVVISCRFSPPGNMIGTPVY